MVINYDDYQNDGWGLSKNCFIQINNIIKEFNLEKINIVEFGSGMSTKFFVDLINYNYNLNIVSYDDNIEYSSKIQHNNLKLHIVNLIECYDSDFENQFNNRQYNKNLFHKKFNDVDTKQKNTFYSIENDELPEKIDLMLIDGPHGNGRSIAFLHGINRLNSGSYVIIDDYTHYDFVYKFKKIFPDSTLIYKSTTGQDNKWELGGDFIIFKIN